MCPLIPHFRVVGPLKINDISSISLPVVGGRVKIMRNEYLYEFSVSPPYFLLQRQPGYSLASRPPSRPQSLLRNPFSDLQTPHPAII